MLEYENHSNVDFTKTAEQFNLVVSIWIWYTKIQKISFYSPFTKLGYKHEMSLQKANEPWYPSDFTNRMFFGFGTYLENVHEGEHNKRESLNSRNSKKCLLLTFWFFLNLNPNR